MKINNRFNVPHLNIQKSKENELYTNWGYGPRENKYNETIIKAVKEKWGNSEIPLSPKLLKAAVAVESSFNPSAISKTGYVGLLQLGINEAKSQGLKVDVPLDPAKDERFCADKNLRAGTGVLKIKNYVIMNPEKYYSSSIKGLSEEPVPQKGAIPEYALLVEEAYKKYGRPSGDKIWELTLAGFNGGSGTVLRAMAKAYQNGIDPTDYRNLIEPRNNPAASPLYSAIKEVYGPSRALDKYCEMSAYPLKIFELYKK